MASPYVTGAVHIGVGISGGSQYLGTCEAAPKISVRPEFVPVMNDLAGAVPFDHCYSGEDGLVSLTLTRWNESVYAALAARASPGGSRGIDFDGDRGTLMTTEEKSVILYCSYPYATLKPAMSTLPNGYRFFSAFLRGPDDLEPGVRPYKIRLVFQCVAVYDPESGRFNLYDHDLSDAPTPD